MCRMCIVRSGFVLKINLIFNFRTRSDLPRGLLMYVMCDVLGPDVDEYSKNGKKAAEAMSLCKEGKSSCYYLLNKARLLLFGISGNKKASTDNLTCVAYITVWVHSPVKSQWTVPQLLSGVQSAQWQWVNGAAGSRGPGRVLKLGTVVL